MSSNGSWAEWEWVRPPLCVCQTHFAPTTDLSEISRRFAIKQSSLKFVLYFQYAHKTGCISASGSMIKDGVGWAELKTKWFLTGNSKLSFKFQISVTTNSFPQLELKSWLENSSAVSHKPNYSPSFIYFPVRPGSAERLDSVKIFFKILTQLKRWRNFGKGCCEYKRETIGMYVPVLSEFMSCAPIHPNHLPVDIIRTIYYARNYLFH